MIDETNWKEISKTLGILNDDELIEKARTKPIEAFNTLNNAYEALVKEKENQVNSVQQNPQTQRRIWAEFKEMRDKLKDLPEIPEIMRTAAIDSTQAEQSVIVMGETTEAANALAGAFSDLIQEHLVLKNHVLEEAKKEKAEVEKQRLKNAEERKTIDATRDHLLSMESTLFKAFKDIHGIKTHQKMLAQATELAKEMHAEQQAQPPEETKKLYKANFQTPGRKIVEEEKEAIGKESSEPEKPPEEEYDELKFDEGT